MTSDTPQPARLDMELLPGSGTPTLVFTHGWANDRTGWDGVMAATDGHPRISWSLRGHGESEITPPGTYTRDHALADFDVVLDHVDGPVVLIGHSLGGYLSLAQTLRHPDRVVGLVLVGAGPGFRNDEAREQWNVTVDAQAAKLGVPEGSEVISKHYDSWVIDEMGSITAPTLVVLGERDKAFAASAKVFAKNLDVRKTVVVPGAGHNVHAKAPVEVAAALDDFLTTL